MWYNLYEFVHNSMGMHFWDLMSLVVGAVIIVMLIVHTINQKRRENRYEKERNENLRTLQKEGSGIKQNV